ncbi:MAG: hypothetical protein PHV47_02130 [Candidatus Pacebacteria bacterium]|nr:hypothetical protein [Candidatus Paceibacterota bacterium]
MITQQLIDFIKDQLKQGKSEEDIKQTLLLQGWKEEDLNQGFFTVKNPGMDIPSPPPIVNSSATDSNSLKRLSGIKELFFNSWAIFKNNFWRFWLIKIIFLAIILILSGGIVFGGIKLLRVNLVLSLILLIIATLLASFLMSASQIAIILISANNDLPTSFGKILKISLTRMFSFWWLFLLNAALTFAFILPGLVLLILGYIFDLFVLSVLGFILIFILSIFIGIYLSQTTFIYILEKEGLINSFSRSWSYVKNNWWKVFGRLFLFGILWSIIAWLLVLILNIFLTKRISDSIVEIISFFLITPLISGYAYSIYRSLKGLKGNDPINQKFRGRFIALIIVGAVVVLATIGYAIYLVKIQFIFDSALINNSPVNFNLNSGATSAKDARIQANLRQLRSVAEIIYIESNSFKDVCEHPSYSNIMLKTNIDGIAVYLANEGLNTKLLDISAIHDDIKANGGSIFCASTQEGYCACSLLNNFSYFCVDNNGVAKSYTSSLPTCGYLDEQSTILSHCQ